MTEHTPDLNSDSDLETNFLVSLNMNYFFDILFSIIGSKSIIFSKRTRKKTEHSGYLR